MVDGELAEPQPAEASARDEAPEQPSDEDQEGGEWEFTAPEPEKRDRARRAPGSAKRKVCCSVQGLRRRL